MRVVELQGAPPPAAACAAFLDLPGCALLESVQRYGDLGRWSFLSADPFLRLRAKGRRLTWSGPAAADDPTAGSGRVREGDPFDALGSELARWRAAAPAAGERSQGLPPFRGGALGYFAYDLLHHLERVPPPRFDDLCLPDLDVGFYDWVLAWDHVAGRAWVLSTGLPDAEGAARERRAAARVELALRRLRGGPRAPAGIEAGAGPSRYRPAATSRSRGAGSSGLTAAASRSPVAAEAPSRAAPPTWPVGDLPDLRSTFSRADYLAAVERAREYVLAGDVFQVNLSQRLSLPYGDSAFGLYRRLRGANPAPFAAFLAGEEAAVVSVSPERFLRLSGDRVETRPIKGTSARGYTPEHDFALGDDLVASEKNRAENVMIVDLLRNDLSRVAQEGSVKVPDLWRVERHPTVHHLVSTVTARLRPGVSAVDLLRATFPGGSITGAPKVRAMEIIHELEPTRRGVYCGSIGYIGFDGEADLSIAIRTAAVKGGTAYFSVGGAVVADSDPAAEYRETLLKAAGLLRGLSAPVAVGD